MDITWLGHSCFRLRGRDVTVVTDPYDRSIPYAPLRLTADIVTVSHEHGHHSYSEAVQLPDRRLRRIDGPGEYEIGGAMITGVATGRDKHRGPDTRRNTAYLLAFDDLTVCHLGNLQDKLEAEQIDVLKGPDVLLIPVGGNTTVDAAQAVEVVSQLEPRLVIPMHFGTPGLPIESADRFCRELAATETTPIPRLTVTRTTLPADTQVILLSPPEARR